MCLQSSAKCNTIGLTQCVYIWRWTDLSFYDSMHDGDQIIKYIVHFNQHAAVIGYGDNSLCYAFYCRLCTWIKDDMAHHDKPNNLHDMQTLAQKLDTWYWTQKAKIMCKNHDKPSSFSFSKPKGSGSNLSPFYNFAVPKPSSSGSAGSNLSSSSSLGAAKKPYADKLSKDGKLMPKEKEHCHMNNLCMFCGNKAQDQRLQQVQGCSFCAWPCSWGCWLHSCLYWFSSIGVRKIESSPASSAQGQGCIDCHCTSEIITLNTATLSNHSLTVSLSSEVGSGLEPNGSPISIILYFFCFSWLWFKLLLCWFQICWGSSSPYQIHFSCSTMTS